MSGHQVIRRSCTFVHCPILQPLGQREHGGPKKRDQEGISAIEFPLTPPIWGIGGVIGRSASLVRRTSSGVAGCPERPTGQWGSGGENNGREWPCSSSLRACRWHVRPS